MNNKSTLQEIEERFDHDVEWFSNIETGQQTTLDALYNMELIAEGISLKNLRKINKDRSGQLDCSVFSC